jgi:hypothetical protein
MRAVSSVYDFGLCSPEPDLPPDEYDLHSLQDTTILFRTSIGDQECDVQLIFHPFRRTCNLTYHEYEVRCFLPRGTPRDAVCKRSVVKAAQRIYEMCFSKKAGYKLDVLESE